MEMKKHPTMNCCYSLRDKKKLFSDDILYSGDKEIAIYYEYSNVVKVFASAGSATKRYAEWFAKEMQNIYGKYPAIKFYDMKRRDRIFQIKDEDRLGKEYANFQINVRQLIKAMKLGYIEKDSCQNNSPSALQMLEFALENEGKGDFTFSGYLIYPPRADFRATIETIGVDIRHPHMLKQFKEFTRTADLFKGNGLFYFAWWD